ncbi:PadR family transcriptional regulator [Jeongeupia chitinilytica]|uniref:PadR family transcriptional regulator n=1 Tax=Jeongeupia chitinilytica TaxID=1041641 RepID=A0ABQ3GXB1_9NEIS|nr:PadR family transcriptional regulator [Jeongeupia chitinilytica]GHD56864.1 PadR family transcriptional regulator [Jeongeupia chitinilytica]
MRNELGHRGGGRRGRVFDHGDLRLVVLALTAQSPRHGYEIIKAIEEKFGGNYAPSPGAIYPTLTLLDEQGLLRGEVDADGKRHYTVTPDGEAYIAANRATIDGVMVRMELMARRMAGHLPPERVMQAMQTLKQALLLREHGWSDASVAVAAKAIEDAARAIVDAPN